MTFIKEYSGVIALVILAIMGCLSFMGVGKSDGLAGSTACSSITCLAGGLRLVSDLGGDFESDVAALFAAGMTVTGTTTINGNVVIPTSNTATSSIQVGCIQTTATSTATPIRLAFSTANNATTTFTGTAFGLAAWEFGKCPKI